MPADNPAVPPKVQEEEETARAKQDNWKGSNDKLQMKDLNDPLEVESHRNIKFNVRTCK